MKYKKLSDVPSLPPLSLLSAATAILTRDPEGPEVLIVNALRATRGAAEIWTRWLPLPPGSSLKVRMDVDLRVTALTGAVHGFVSNVIEELDRRLRMQHTEIHLRLSQIAFAAPAGAPSLIWAAAHDAAWQERLRQQDRRARGELSAPISQADMASDAPLSDEQANTLERALARHARSKL